MIRAPSHGIVLMAIATHGLKLPEEPWELMVVALRSKKHGHVEWPDLVGPLWLDDEGRPSMRLHRANTRTEPLVLPGQYTGALVLGRHLGLRPALVQSRPMRYQGPLGEVIEEHGRTDLLRVIADADFASANPVRPEAIVIANITAYEAMLELCQHCASKRGGSFDLTVMEWESR